MNNFKTREKEKLNDFRDYLINVAKLSESTSDDYCKRIMTICTEEGIELEDLSDTIETLCYEYVSGTKKEKGARSHNSYRGSILKFRDYIEWAQSQHLPNTDKRYLVHMCNSRISNSNVGVAEMIDTSTNQVVGYKPYTKEEMKTNGTNMVMKMVWDMAYDIIVKEKGIPEIITIISSQNIGLEIEDDITKTIKKFF